MKNSKKYGLKVFRGNKTKMFWFNYMYQMDEAYDILTNAGWEVMHIEIRG